MNSPGAPFFTLETVVFLLLILLHSTSSARTLCPTKRQSPSASDKTPSSSLPFRKASCINPTGSCVWYRTCLYNIGTCGDLGYAVKFQEAFCLNSRDKQGLMYPEGIAWVNAVNKCLQEELVPLIKKCNTTACSEVQTTALNSHSWCYVSPQHGVSICDLSCIDLVTALNVVKTSIIGYRSHGVAEREFREAFQNCPSVVCPIWGKTETG